MGSGTEEGEILDAGSVPHTQAASRLQFDGNGVDRQGRPRHERLRYADSTGSRNSRSPDRGGDGRARDHSTRDYSSRRDGGRRNRASYYDRDAYDDRVGDSRYRSRGPRSSAYVDLDRPNAAGGGGGSDAGGDGYDTYRGGGGRYGDSRKRDWDGDDYRDPRGYVNKRFRTRSPSPPGRSPRHGPSRTERGQRVTYGNRDSQSQKEGTRRDGGEPVSARAAAAAIAARAGHGRFEDAKQLQGLSRRNDASPSVEEQPRSVATGLEPDMESTTVQDEAPEVIDEDAEIERRRRRREAILAKSSSATPLLVQALHSSDQPSASPREPAQTPDAATPITDSPSPAPAHDPESPVPFDFDTAGTIGNSRTSGTDADADADGPSAADYDPTADMQEDERRDERRQGQVGLHGQPVGQQAVGKPHDEARRASHHAHQDQAADAEGADDGDFDMFAEEFDDDKYAAANPTAQTARPQPGTAAGAVAPADGAILEDDDKEGYYKIRPGEMLEGRYQLQAALGKGMFSGVARAVDVTTNKPVAIKIMRNNDALRKGGYTEISILQKLNSADPDDRKHIVRFQHHFDFKGHLCLAFEHMSMNLREVLRKFGNNVGINLDATRAYAHQIFVALAHMRRCTIIHADLKPDNILVSESRNAVKVCDLGTAIDRSDAATAQDAVTPYLVSRFYRAPELILGIPYDYGVDMWSVGCTLYELYTGKILFAGDSNNQMLKSIMETRGRIMPKLYKKGQLSAMHFDDMGRFRSVETDKFGKTVVKMLPMTKPTRELRTRLTAVSAGLSDSEAKDVNLFLDLLEQCLALNPDKRIKPAEALKHPFFTSRIGVGRQ